MASRYSNINELVRERLTPDALARGRQLYLSSAVRELRIDVRRRRYSAIVDDVTGTATVEITQQKNDAAWICSVHGRSHPDCPHVAAVLTGIREREAIEGDNDSASAKTGKAERVSLVDHLMGEASREHLIQAFKLCLKTYPELQGDLVFTILENIDTSGELYDEVIALMDSPASSTEFTLPKEGFDPYRLLDEILYLYEQEKYQQAFLLSRSVIAFLLEKLHKKKKLVDYEIDLVIASAGMLSDLTLPPSPEQLIEQVHELGMRLLRKYPKLEPQIQSSLIAFIDDETLNETGSQELETRLRRRWERARKSGKAEQELEEAERLAMPLALFYARTRQFDKLQNLFDRYLQNPLLRAPALAEMMHHNLQEVVIDYVETALTIPDENTTRDDPEDIARCGMYNDLVMMLIDSIDEVDHINEQQRAALLRKAFMSIGHRIYGILDVYREAVDEKEYQAALESMAAHLEADANRGVYVAMTKYFVLLGELGQFDKAYNLIVEQGSVDPVILLDYLPHLLPKYADELYEPALISIVELLPLVAEDGLRDLLQRSINLVWDINEQNTRETLNRHFIDIIDDDLADFVDILLGDFEDSELDL